MTLAHVARPIALARALGARFEAVLACDGRWDAAVGALPFERRPLGSISSERFFEALRAGRPIYDAATLRRYVEEDVALIAEVRPDVVVGDFRLSLSVSARSCRVPYLAIANATWSPHARAPFPAPDLPFVRALGVRAGSALFDAVRPIAFALHARPLETVRREHGMPALGGDLRRAYTDADRVLYADVPELHPTFDLPARHRYLGPVLWSPAVAPPPWWDELPCDRPLVYVTLGSSGGGALLPLVLRALGELPVTVVAASAGRADAGDGAAAALPANVRIAAFLPGEAAARRADLVVANGGSPTVHQALAAGTPVLGIPGNLDQHLSMAGVVLAGAGESLRSDRCSEAAVRETARRMLAQARYRRAAQALAKVFARYPAGERFRAIVDEVLAARAVSEDVHVDA